MTLQSQPRIWRDAPIFVFPGRKLSDFVGWTPLTSRSSSHENLKLKEWSLMKQRLWRLKMGFTDFLGGWKHFEVVIKMKKMKTFHLNVFPFRVTPSSQFLSASSCRMTPLNPSAWPNLHLVMCILSLQIVFNQDL